MTTPVHPRGEYYQPVRCKTSPREQIRAGADGDTLHEALAGGVEVLPDDWSLRERGIRDADLARGIRPASVDLVVERLAGAWEAVFL